MKKIIICSFLLGLIYVFSADEAAAQIPPGSYTQTCQIASVDSANGSLTAVCNSKSGKQKLNRDFKYKYCVGDISNQDGYLSCTKDKAKMAADAKAADEKAAAEKAKKDAQQTAEDNSNAKQAEKQKIAKLKPVFDAGALLVIGREASPAEVAFWSKAIEKKFTTAEQHQDGIKLPQVLTYMKALVSDPISKFMRADTIDRAYLEVYGRETTPTEQAAWDSEFKAGKATYASMVLGEKNKLNKNAAERRAMIDRAYLKSMGRNAGEGDIKYWQSSSDHFRQIVESARTFLYSNNGVNDRVETATRALKAANKPASDGEVKKILTAFSSKKAIYTEIVAELKKS